MIPKNNDSERFGSRQQVFVVGSFTLIVEKPLKNHLQSFVHQELSFIDGASFWGIAARSLCVKLHSPFD